MTSTHTCVNDGRNHSTRGPLGRSNRRHVAQTEKPINLHQVGRAGWSRVWTRHSRRSKSTHTKPHPGATAAVAPPVTEVRTPGAPVSWPAATRAISKQRPACALTRVMGPPTHAAWWWWWWRERLCCNHLCSAVFCPVPGSRLCCN